WSVVRRNAEWRAAPALEHRDLRDGLARELGELFRWLAERHDCGHGNVRREAEERLKLRLLRNGHGRNGPAEPFATRGEQDVPHERVDRGPADNSDAPELLIHGRYHPQVDTDDEDQRCRDIDLRHAARR